MLNWGAHIPSHWVHYPQFLVSPAWLGAATQIAWVLFIVFSSVIPHKPHRGPRKNILTAPLGARV